MATLDYRSVVEELGAATASAELPFSLSDAFLFFFLEIRPIVAYLRKLLSLFPLVVGSIDDMAVKFLRSAWRERDAWVVRM